MVATLSPCHGAEAETIRSKASGETTPLERAPRKVTRQGEADCDKEVTLCQEGQ